MDNLLDLNQLGAFFSNALQSQLAQFGLAFGLAAWIHSGQVRKEIRLQMSGITEAFNNLALALRQDLDTHSKRISNVEEDLDKIKKTIKGEKKWTQQ